MNIQETIDKMNKIQNNLLAFLDYERNIEENFQNLYSLLTDLKILDDRHLFKSFLHLLMKLANNHHREQDFFSKIETILSNLKSNIKNHFSNLEIFYIFKSNKRIFLFIIESDIINLEENIVSRLISQKFVEQNYPKFLSIEIKEKFIKKYQNNRSYKIKYDWNQDLFYRYPLRFDEKRIIGENDNELYEIIRKDLVKKFIEYTEDNMFLLKTNIVPSIYETNPYLLKKRNTTLIEYAAFFGAIKIIEYLQSQEIKLTQSLWVYAIHSNNANVIHFLEKNNVELNEKLCKKCIKETIKCHHNVLGFYIRKKFLNDEHKFEKEFFVYGLKYYNFVFIQNNFINMNYFKFMCKYDHYQFAYEVLKNMNVNINICNEIISKIINFF